jgi:hypothetical protein
MNIKFLNLNFNLNEFIKFFIYSSIWVLLVKTIEIVYKNLNFETVLDDMLLWEMAIFVIGFFGSISINRDGQS